MSDSIGAGSFSQGFEAGYRAIKGTNVHLPHVPHEPFTKHNSTPYLMGIRKGIERATGKDIDDIS